MNDLINLLKDIGYPFLFIWSVFEGEIGLMLAGWLSSEKIFLLKNVILIGISGAMIGDFIVFMIGRIFKEKANNYLEKKQKKEMINRWIEKYGVFIIVFERFIYGTHIPILLTFGISKIGFFKWFVFDIIGVVLWAITFSLIGFYFGNDVIDFVMYIQKEILVVIGIILVIIYFRYKKF